MKIELTLEFVSKDKKFLRSLYYTLLPDNIDFPEGLEVDLFNNQNGKFTIILASEGHFETLLSTLNELLDNVEVSTTTLSEVIVNA